MKTNRCYCRLVDQATPSLPFPGDGRESETRRGHGCGLWESLPSRVRGMMTLYCVVVGRVIKVSACKGAKSHYVRKGQR